jgi:hypothetical protein
LRNLLLRHREEWRNYVSSLGQRSFVRQIAAV